MSLTGLLLKGFGAGGSSTPPGVPTLTITDISEGDVTANIANTTSGSTNTIFTLGALDSAWQSVGSREGDGILTFSVEASGRYFIYVRSELDDGQVADSLIVTFWVIGNPSLDVFHSPAMIVQKLLSTIGLGVLPETSPNGDWPIFAHSEPTSPDNTVTIYDTSGIVEGRIQFGGEIPEHYGIQVRVRTSDHSGGGWAKIKEIAQAFDCVVSRDTVAIEDSVYVVHSVTRKGGVLSLGRESPTSARVLFTLNALVSLRQTS